VTAPSLTRPTAKARTRRRAPRRLPVLAAVAAAAALAGASPARAGVRPGYGGELRVLLAAAPRSADPARATDPADLILVRAVHATPLEVDAAGKLEPGLLEEVPAPAAGGRAFRLRLRAGLRFADGTPLVAADVAASLARLLREGANAWVALPILGADAYLGGKAATLAGVQVLSDRELLVTLAFTMPEWPRALAAPAAAVVSSRGAGAGPFVLQGLDAAGARLVVNPFHGRGRAFADRLTFTVGDTRAAARALARGEADLVLRPEPVAGAAAATETAPLLATVAAINGRRLGAGAQRVRNVLASLDRAELGRQYARGPSARLDTLVPAPLLPLPAPPRPATPADGGAPAARVVLLAAADAPDQRAVAERIQVKLFDAGVKAAVEVEGSTRFAARLSAEDFDVALVPVQVQALAPALAAGALAFATRGAAACRRVIAELAGQDLATAAARAEAAARTLDLVPLFSTGLDASAGPELQGLRLRADGGLDLGALWRLPEAPAP
jgi:peptide/nickel transport system substrate-binding protein